MLLDFHDTQGVNNSNRPKNEHCNKGSPNINIFGYNCNCGEMAGFNNMFTNEPKAFDLAFTSTKIIL